MVRGGSTRAIHTVVHGQGRRGSQAGWLIVTVNVIVVASAVLTWGLRLELSPQLVDLPLQFLDLACLVDTAKLTIDRAVNPQSVASCTGCPAVDETTLNLGLATCSARNRCTTSGTRSRHVNSKNDRETRLGSEGREKEESRLPRAEQNAGL
jgi:hypothetical protein